MEATRNLPQNFTLAEYLAKRGTCPALTRLEANIFGVPYPLVAGWPVRFKNVEITAGMLDQLRASIGPAQTATTAKAKRALDSAMGLAVTREARVKVESPTRAPRVSLFPGFAVRPRGPAGVPWKV